MINRFNQITNIVVLLILVGFLASCESKQQSTEPYIDYKFTEFFARNCCGVTGADGFYSVPLPDGRVVWIFGDTFLGTVNADGSREKQSPIFIRNSMAIQDGDSLTTLYQVIDGWESSFVIPPDAVKGTVFSEDSLWYWPGDGLVENGKLKVFMTGFYQAEEGNWGFKWVDATVATFSLPDMTLESIMPLDYPHEMEVHWGHAVCDNAPDYTYIYGAGDKYPFVARAPKGNVTAPWEFFDGKGWVDDSRKARPMVDIKGSEQFSVFKIGDKYVLMTQTGDFLYSSLVSMTSDEPYTGWGNQKELYKPVPLSDDKNLFAYNSVAHPFFTENGELLVSYCVNSFELEDVFQDASKYRPVFIRIPEKMILEK